MERGIITAPERVAYDLEQREFDDVTTWLAECMDGGMRTEFEYQLLGDELYSRDGSPMGPIFQKSLHEAEALVHRHPNLAFEPRRRRLESDEYEDMLAMAHDQAPNTMVVVSDFPWELLGATHDVGGYNVSRKQTMLRVITKHPDGRIVMRSQSLDLSDRAGLEAIFSSLGFEAQPGELLGQRMHLELDGDEQDVLIDRLMGVYDRKLHQEYGGKWHAGRSGARAASTYDFVCSQRDLLHAYFYETGRSGYSDTLLYDLVSTMKARYTERAFSRIWKHILEPGFDRPASEWGFTSPSHEVLMHEMRMRGAQSRAAGDIYSGCGASLGADQNDPNGDHQAAGYGNKSKGEDGSETYKFDKYMHCVVCQAPPKKDEPKKMCGPCGICKGCDIKLSAKKSEYALAG